MPFDYLDDPGRLLDGVIRQRAAELGDKAFCEFGAMKVTFAEFDRRVEQVARGLLALGLEPGAAVCAFMNNAPELLYLMFGVHRAGGVYVPCSPHSALNEVAYQVEHSGARVIVVDGETAEVGCAIAAGCGADTVVATGTEAVAGALSFADLIGQAGSMSGPLPELSPNEVCTVMYTSGTTSRPKGVMLTHGNHAAAAANLVAAYDWHHTDRFLHFFPMYHANGGMVTVFPALVAGATLVMLEKFSASRFPEQLVEHDITFTAVNSTNCRILLSSPPRDAERAHRVRRMVLGLTLDSETTEEFERRFRTRLCQSYGLTEGNCISLAVAPLAPRRPGSSGSVLRGYRAKVTDGHGTELPPGEDGELWITSVQRHGLANGYLGAPELTEKMFVGGWLHTGDQGHFDETGTFWYTGRVTDMIKRSGYNVSPAEVERVISGISGVAGVAVVSTPDAVYDEAIVAFVEVTDGSEVTSDQVLERCQENLSAYKLPQRVELVPELPTTFVGKLDRAALREWASKLTRDQS